MNQLPRKSHGSLAHVALRAGVSPSTASRALAGNPKVSKATVERVHQAAAELNYVPNRYARTLRTGSSEPLLGVVIDPDTIFGVDRDTHKFWFVSLFTMFEQLAAAHVGALSISSRAPELFEKVHFDAMLVLSLADSPTRLRHLPRDVPTLALSSLVNSGSGQLAVAGYDYAQIATDAFDLLAARGSSKVAFVARPGDLLHLEIVTTEYERWCTAHGQEPVVLGRTGTNEQLSEAVARACLDDGVDGLFSMRGESRSVLEGIQQAGLHCPRDVRFLATGEGTGEQLLHPTVSMVYLDPVTAGQELAVAVLELLAGKKVSDLRLAYRIQERESTQT